MKFFRQLRALFRKEKLDAEMAEEMRAHLELQAAENENRGMSHNDARFAARRLFGGIEQIKERARDQRNWVWLEQLRQDGRFAFRSLRNNPTAFFLDLWHNLPRHVRLRGVRADSGSCLPELLELWEQLRLPYVVAAQLAEPIKGVRRGGLAWTPTEVRGTDVAEMAYQTLSWSQPRRLILIRHLRFASRRSRIISPRCSSAILAGSRK